MPNQFLPVPEEMGKPRSGLKARGAIPRLGGRRSSRWPVGSIHSTKGRTMVKAVVLYGPPEYPDAFERYYADTHTGLAQRIPGLQRFEAARGSRRRTAARSPTNASPS
jgi:hypothetical protein